MLHADNKEKARKTTPAGRINTPEDTIAKSFSPPPMFGEEGEKEEEYAVNGEELSATEKIKASADKKKKKKGL